MKKSELKNEELREFFRLEVANLAENTQKSKMFAITKFLKIIGNPNIKDIGKKHILKYIESDYFTDLSNSTKNLRLTHIGTFLKFHEREELIDLFPNYKEANKELNKSELINREDLEKILKSCGTLEYKTLIIVLYESAVRKKELVNIKRRNLQFYENYCNLYIDTSKSRERNIPLVESIPFLREFLNKTNLKENECLFSYSAGHINYIIDKIERLTRQKYDTFNKSINPHLFRHSRLTELASNRKLNEPQLRKFAGWSKDSNMTAVYFHLDDTSIRNEIINQAKKDRPKKPKREGFESLRCPNCSEFNNKFNQFCWKCGKIINKDIIAERLNEKQRIKTLEQNIRELKKLISYLLEREKDVGKKIEDIIKIIPDG